MSAARGRPVAALDHAGRRELRLAHRRVERAAGVLGELVLERAAVAARCADDGAGLRAIAAELGLSVGATHELVRAGRTLNGRPTV